MMKSGWFWYKRLPVSSSTGSGTQSSNKCHSPLFVVWVFHVLSMADLEKATDAVMRAQDGIWTELTDGLSHKKVEQKHTETGSLLRLKGKRSSEGEEASMQTRAGGVGFRGETLEIRKHCEHSSRTLSAPWGVLLFLFSAAEFIFMANLSRTLITPTQILHCLVSGFEKWGKNKTAFLMCVFPGFQTCCRWLLH